MAADVKFGAGGHKMLDRIIRARFGFPEGVLCLPASDDAPDGWGNPVTPGTEPLGTIGGTNPYNLFRRGPESTEVNLLRRQVRPFTSIQVCDWRGPESAPGAGDMTVLHFHGPHCRYFPVSTGGTVFSERLPADLYGTFFYANKGNLVINSPNGSFVKGVAIRLKDDVPEYIIVTNDDLYTIGTTEFWARPVAGDESSWYLVESINAADFGIGIGSTSGQLQWRVPAHFNRLGTRAVTMAKGTPTVPATSGHLHKIEFTIGPDSVSFTVEDVTVFETGSLTAAHTDDEETIVDPPCPPNSSPNPCPEIPFCGSPSQNIPPASILQTVDTTFDDTWQLDFQSSHAAMPLAFDYKIDSDTDLGKIEYSQSSESTTFHVSHTETHSEYQVCFFIGGITGPRIVAAIAPFYSLTTSQNDVTRTNSASGLYTMDGGRNSFSIGVDFTEGLSGTQSRTDTHENNDGDITDTSSWSFTNTTSEPTDYTNWGSGLFQREMCAADIRYGSMILREAKDLHQGVTPTPSGESSPNFLEPIGAPQTKNSPSSGPFIGQMPLDACFLTFGDVGPTQWTAGVKLKVVYHIEAEGVSETREVEDELYAVTYGAFGGSLYLALLGWGPQFTSFGEQVFIINNEPGGPTGPTFPTILGTGNRIGQHPGQQAQAVHDRFGDYFWTVAADENNFMTIGFGGFGGSYSPQDLNIGDADYVFQDPVVVTGIPGDNPRFDPVSLL